MNWTQSQIDELMRLYRDGLTARQIAAQFGVTRNAVIGRIHRERIKLGEVESKPRNRTDRKQRSRKMLTLPRRAEFAVSTYVQNAPQKPCEGLLTSIVDVTGCKWPVKDDAAYVGRVAFCNHAVAADGKPYYPFHTQEAIAPYSAVLIKKTIYNALYTLKRRAA